MARADLTQEQVLAAIEARVRAALSLNPSQCYLAIEPLPDKPQFPIGGDFIVTVAPGEGVFIEGEQAPGNVTEDWNIHITAYTRIQLDAPDRFRAFLLDADRGVFPIKRKILQALVGVDVQETTQAPAREFLRQLGTCLHCTAPDYNKDDAIGWIRLTFKTEWDWDIES